MYRIAEQSITKLTPQVVSSCQKNFREDRLGERNKGGRQCGKGERMARCESAWKEELETVH